MADQGKEQSWGSSFGWSIKGGKTRLLTRLMAEQSAAGREFIFLDPLGDEAKKMMKWILDGGDGFMDGAGI